MFLYSFLSSVRTLNVENHGVTGELNKAYKGIQNVTFETAVDKVKKISQTGSNTNNIPDVVAALKKVDGLISHKDDLPQLVTGFKQYLKAVLEAVKQNVQGQGNREIGLLCSQLQNLLDKVGEKNGDLGTPTKNVKDAEINLSYKSLRQPARSLVEGVKLGTTSFMTQLEKKDGYKSSYIPSSSWNGGADNHTISRIFLGCLPLYYYWLTYLYWKCKQPHSQGGWADEILSRPTLKNFLVGQGYNGNYINTQNRSVKGSRIATLIQSIGLSSVTHVTQRSHPDMLSELNNSLQGVIGSSGSTTLNDHSLSALFYLCRYYFTGKQIINPVTERRSPTSIREMLYWLCGLQFSPHYSDIEKQIEAFIPAQHGLPVADSGTSSPNNFITRDQMKGFLLSSCLSAPGVLGTIQGNSTDDPKEPWLHKLFCNTMNLQYPSGYALFNTLANYTYALQFQLLFLYQQCRTNYSQSYGWQWCRYGQSAQPNGQKAKELASWICSSSNCTTPTCQHNSDRCQHIKECGQANKHSPLQAFLTDNLKGFHVSQKPDADSTHHLDNHPPGSMCHVPMGFDGTLTKDANATGWYIYYLLEHFCSNSKTPLRQLCEKLGCLTKLTPRTLGDLFGFLWHLNGQLFKDAHVIHGFKTAVKQKPYNIEDFNTKFKTAIKSHTSQSSPGKSRIVESFESMGQTIPFLYQLYTIEESNSVPDALFDLTYHCHRKETGHSGNSTRLVHKDHSGRPCSTANDLWSLYQPVSNTGNNSDCKSGACGGYLYPLTHTDGATYVPVLASAYLSWFLYLTDDFDTGLRDMLERFKGLSCTNCQLCHSGSHGSASCSCPSIVECSGVLPLLYSNGFSFGNAYSLKGGTQGTDPMRRNCHKFHSQLTGVLTQNESTPLFKLLTTIDEFLYMFRFYFFYNLSSFWIMYV